MINRARSHIIASIRQFIAFLVICNGIIACDQKANEYENTYCLSERVVCSSQETVDAKIEVTERLVIEQPTPFKVTLPAEWHVNKAEAKLVGKNMFMGYIPVLLTQTDKNELSGELLVVACTRPDMVWQFEIHVELNDGRAKLLTWPFATYTE